VSPVERFNEAMGSIGTSADIIHIEPTTEYPHGPQSYWLVVRGMRTDTFTKRELLKICNIIKRYRFNEDVEITDIQKDAVMSESLDRFLKIARFENTVEESAIDAALSRLVESGFDISQMDEDELVEALLPVIDEGIRSWLKKKVKDYMKAKDAKNAKKTKEALARVKAGKGGFADKLIAKVAKATGGGGSGGGGGKAKAAGKKKGRKCKYGGDWGSCTDKSGKPYKKRARKKKVKSESLDHFYEIANYIAENSS